MGVYFEGIFLKKDGVVEHQYKLSHFITRWIHVLSWLIGRVDVVQGILANWLCQKLVRTCRIIIQILESFVDLFVVCETIAHCGYWWQGHIAMWVVCIRAVIAVSSRLLIQIKNRQLVVGTLIAVDWILGAGHFIGSQWGLFGDQSRICSVGCVAWLWSEATVILIFFVLFSGSWGRWTAWCWGWRGNSASNNDSTACQAFTSQVFITIWII